MSSASRVRSLLLLGAAFFLGAAVSRLLTTVERPAPPSLVETALVQVPCSTTLEVTKPAAVVESPPTPSLRQQGSKAPSSSATQRKPKLTDGCWGVYLDVGSNLGVQVRKVFEGEKYSGAPVLPYFNRHFGSPEQRRAPGRVCAIGFEANPVHGERLKKVEACYQSKGWKTHFFVPTAVLNSDNQTIDFILDTAAEAHYWGASMFRYRESDSANVHKVPTINLGRFIAEEVRGRLLPEGYDTPGPVYAKFDIEGAEYQTFGGMMMTGAVCDITEASIEYHERVISADEVAPAQTITRMMQDMSRLPSKYLGCTFMRMDRMDDESFLHDGQPPPDGCSALQ